LRNQKVSYTFVTERLRVFTKMRRDVFQAIADPTRREIINMVAHQSLNLNAVAEKFDISRPAISKHIKILTECGLIVIKQKGRERYCEAKLNKLGEVSKWTEQYKAFWTTKLDALEKFLAKETSADKKQRPVKKSKRK
jgi:DNA-binding transcriptional ArsR family regulator